MNIMTIQRAAQTAVDCQDACNLSGVLYSFADAMKTAIRPEAERLNKGTDWINQHPIVYMFAYKLLALNGHEVSNIQKSAIPLLRH